MDKRTEALIEFLNKSHSTYHAVALLTEQLEQAGYSRLNEAAEWKLAWGGKYYLTRGGSAVFAFRVPEGSPKGFLLSASHADRPCMKVKENGEAAGAYNRLQVERYGGPILSTWLDRPLSVAGRVLVETDSGVEHRLVDIDRDLMVIPNLAIHMGLAPNDGYKWNVAKDMPALLGGKDTEGKLQKLLEEQAGGKILGHDLTLYIREKASVWGLEEEYLSAPALDDLECAWGCTQGFLKAGSSGSIPVLCVFDSEEVGSSSVQGAASDMLGLVLQRICRCLNVEYGQMLAQSFMVSADNAHAVHPNHPEQSDAANAPKMGEGVVVKFNSDLRYTTDGLSAAIFRKICAKAGVPVQNFYNRADKRGGGTLGAISLSHVSVPSLDIGLAQLAMHSAYETASVQDAIYLEEAMTAYYGSTLERPEDGIYALG